MSTRPTPVNDPKWVWIGRKIRHNARTISVLAIVETVAASALALYAAFAWGATNWFMTYVCISPLLLLKTKWSGVSAAGRGSFSAWRVLGGINHIAALFVGATHGHSRCWKILVYGPRVIFLTLAVTILTLATYIWLLGIKIYSIIFRSREEWILSMRRMPKNWTEACLQMDLSRPPQPLPDWDRYAAETETLSWAARDEVLAADRAFRSQIPNYFSKRGPLDLAALHLHGRRDWFDRPLTDWLGIWLMKQGPLRAELLLIVGYAYRMSIKATALLWVPLLYFTRPIFRKGDTLEWRVKDLLDHPFNKLMRLWGLVTVTAHLVVPFLFWKAHSSWTEWLKEQSPQLQHVWDFLLVTRSAQNGFPLDLWHVAGALSAILTWVMWKLAHDHRIAMDSGAMTPVQEKKALSFLQFMLWGRAALVTYTFFCGMIAVLKTLNWISVDVRVFPDSL